MSRTLSGREQKLAWLVGSVAFLFGNYFLFEWATSAFSQVQSSIASQEKQLQLISTLSSDAAFWEKREAWLTAQQPRLENPDTAAVQLLDQIKATARNHDVLVENPVIRVAERQPEYISVSVDVETKSPWPPAVKFLHELQRGNQFIAVESSNLKIDATDPTQMRGRFRIARWYSVR